MNHYEAINDVLVNLFNEILDLEERALITGEYKNISVNDMHIINAVGIREQKNMSTVARELNVTVGTLTIAVNNLVKKGIYPAYEKSGGPKGCADLPDRTGEESLLPS